MKRYSIFIALLSVLFFSCKKEEEVLFNNVDLDVTIKLLKKGEQADQNPYSPVVIKFSKSIGKEFTIKGKGVVKIELDEFKVDIKETNEIIEGTIHWNDQQDTLWFVPSQPLQVSSQNIRVRGTLKWKLKEGDSFQDLIPSDTEQPKLKAFIYAFRVTTYYLNTTVKNDIGFYNQKLWSGGIKPFDSFKVLYKSPTSKNHGLFLRSYVIDTQLSSNDKPIDHTMENSVESGKDTYNLYPHYPLSNLEGETIKLTAKLGFKRKIADQWEVLKEGDQPLVYRTLSEEFSIDEEALNSDIRMKIVPIEGDNQVSVYTSSFITFSQVPEEPLTSNRFLRPSLKEAVLTDNAGNTVPLKSEMNKAEKKIMLIPQTALNENTNYTLTTTAEWQFYDGTQWVSTGEQYTNQERVNFTTSASSDSELIAHTNFEHSYPVFRQNYFLKEEYAKGHITINHIDETVLAKINSSSDFQAHFIDPQGNLTEIAATFVEDSLTFHFQIPPTLLNHTIYQMKIVGLSSTAQVNALFTKYHFKTSHYNTFEEKMNALEFGFSWSYAPSISGINPANQIGHRFNKTALGEGIDAAELNMIKCEAILEGNPYYEEHMQHIYKPVLEGLYTLKNRNGEQYGIPPTKAVYIRNATAKNLTIDEINTKISVYNTTDQYISFVYDLALYYRDDFGNLHRQIDSKKDSGEPLEDWEQKIHSHWYTDISNFYGYDNLFYIRYKVPGTKVVTYEKEYNLPVPTPIQL